jgi:hypothetical protein
MGCQQIALDAAYPTVKGLLDITLLVRRRTELEFAAHMFVMPICDEQPYIE